MGNKSINTIGYHYNIFIYFVHFWYYLTNSQNRQNVQIISVDNKFDIEYNTLKGGLKLGINEQRSI